jgi:O-6-methylguanine DNA methyltransferase
MKPMPVVSLPVHTPDGTFTAHFSERGLAALNFPSADAQPNALVVEMSTTVREWHALAEHAVTAILSGKVPQAQPPLDLTAGTGFQRRVWEELQHIPRGETRSYGEVATAIGLRNTARAVGQACGANPIPLLIPCHRVLAANHRIGGFSGGLDWKRRLLAREQIPVLFERQSMQVAS